MEKKKQQPQDVNISLKNNLEDLIEYQKEVIKTYNDIGFSKHVTSIHEDLLTVLIAVQKASIRTPNPKTLN